MNLLTRRTFMSGVAAALGTAALPLAAAEEKSIDAGIDLEAFDYGPMIQLRDCDVPLSRLVTYGPQKAGKTWHIRKQTDADKSFLTIFGDV